MGKKEEDLGVKIGSKDEVYWTGVLNEAQELVVKGRNDLIINEMIVVLAEKKIEEAKEKFK